jgi:hypothetical protein
VATEDALESHRIPPVVGKRNHFHSIGELVDQYCYRLKPEFKTPEMRAFFEHFADSVMRAVSRDFATAAERGIEQAVKLISDPEYYDTLKARRRRNLEEHEKYEQKQIQERLEREQCPTAAQVEQMRDTLTENIERYERQVRAWKERLAALPKNPKHVRMPER